jgi:hypothetical protein
VDSKTGQTYLQEAQAIVPGIALPYANFGSTSGTINAMLLPHPQYSAISDTWGNVANSNYNSLQLTLKQQTSRGVTFTLNYTYSKEIDDTGCCRSHYDIPAFAITDGIARKRVHRRPSMPLAYGSCPSVRGTLAAKADSSMSLRADGPCRASSATAPALRSTSARAAAWS